MLFSSTLHPSLPNAWPRLITDELVISFGAALFW